MILFFEIKRGELIATKTKTQQTFVKAEVSFHRNPERCKLEQLLDVHLESFNLGGGKINEDTALDYLQQFEKTWYQASLHPFNSKSSVLSFSIVSYFE